MKGCKTRFYGVVFDKEKENNYMENEEDVSIPLDHLFNNDYYNSVEYGRIRDYLRQHKIDDSIAMLIDRKSDSDGCIIAKIDNVDDIGVIVEVEFVDNLSWHVLQVLRLVDGEGGLGGRYVEPVLEPETMIKVIKLIDRIARGLG